MANRKSGGRRIFAQLPVTPVDRSEMQRTELTQWRSRFLMEESREFDLTASRYGSL